MTNLATCSPVGMRPVVISPIPAISPPMEKMVIRTAAAPARNLALMMVSR